MEKELCEFCYLGCHDYHENLSGGPFKKWSTYIYVWQGTSYIYYVLDAKK